MRERGFVVGFTWFSDNLEAGGKNHVETLACCGGKCCLFIGEVVWFRTSCVFYGDSRVLRLFRDGVCLTTAKYIHNAT